MAFAFDEIFAYGGQLIVAAKKVVPKALGVGEQKIDHSAFIQGPLQVGDAGQYGSVEGTVMIGKDSNAGAPVSLHVKGDGTNAVYIQGDLYVSGATDTGNKGRLASRFGAADGRPKPFDIKHPSKEGYRLRYACIEGPEVGVYFRGRVRGEKIIKLPDYWKDLVDVESISVQLQPIGAHQDVIVKRWDENFIYLQAQGGMPVNCFYHVYAARKDVNPLYVEYEGESWKDYPDPNFNPDTAPDTPNYNDPEYRTKRNTITI